MTLRKSPRGLIKPYMREGVTSSLKKTAKDTAALTLAYKNWKPLIRELRKNSPETEEAEDAMLDAELLAIEVAAAAKSSAKELRKTLMKVEKYLAENSE